LRLVYLSVCLTRSRTFTFGLRTLHFACLYVYLRAVTHCIHVYLAPRARRLPRHAPRPHTHTPFPAFRAVAPQHTLVTDLPGLPGCASFTHHTHTRFAFTLSQVTRSVLWVLQLRAVARSYAHTHYLHGSRTAAHFTTGCVTRLFAGITVAFRLRLHKVLLLHLTVWLRVCTLPSCRLSFTRPDPRLTNARTFRFAYNASLHSFARTSHMVSLVRSRLQFCAYTRSIAWLHAHYGSVYGFADLAVGLKRHSLHCSHCLCRFLRNCCTTWLPANLGHGSRTRFAHLHTHLGLRSWFTRGYYVVNTHTMVGSLHYPARRVPQPAHHRAYCTVHGGYTHLSAATFAAFARAHVHLPLPSGYGYYIPRFYTFYHTLRLPAAAFTRFHTRRLAGFPSVTSSLFRAVLAYSSLLYGCGLVPHLPGLLHHLMDLLPFPTLRLVRVAPHWF